MTIHNVNEVRKSEQYPVEYSPSVSQETSLPIPLTDGAPLGQDGVKVEKTSQTQYIVQAGDTPKVIAKKFGLTGQEAKDFAAKIEETAVKDGKYHDFGFRAGDTISLPGSFGDAIEKMRKNGTYYTDLASINEDFIQKTNARKGIAPERVNVPDKKEVSEKTPSVEPAQETKTPVKTPAVQPGQEVKAPVKPGITPAVKNIDGYNTPENTTLVKLSDLKKDNQGRYIIPKGNFAIESSELPGNEIKFVLEDKESNLVFNGKIDKKGESNYKAPVTADIIMKNDEPSDKVYKDGDFEFRGTKYYYQGKEINPDEWDIQIQDVKNASTGKNAGIKIRAVKKDTVQSSKDVKWTERKVDITGPGNFYAEEVDCPLSADVGKFEIGALKKGASGSLSGNGNIQEMDIGNNHGYSFTSQNEVNIRNLESGRVFGDNVDVADMNGGKYHANGTVYNLYGGELSSPKANVVIMNGGHVLAANSIKVMQGGYLDLYKVRYSQPGKTTIENYIAGRIDSCDKAVVVIQNGFEKTLLAQADSPLKEKRGGVISDKEPPVETSVPQGEKVQTAGVGDTVIGWFKKLFS